MNYIIPKLGVPFRIHVVNHHDEPRDITDPLTQRVKTVYALILEVDELNGEMTRTNYSTIADTHKLDFAPYLAGKRYQGYYFTITKVGVGFSHPYSVKVEPR